MKVGNGRLGSRKVQERFLFSVTFPKLCEEHFPLCWELYILIYFKIKSFPLFFLTVKYNDDIQLFSS